MADDKDQDEQPSKLSAMLRNAAQSVIGDSPTTGDGIEPEGSPIDLLAGGLGSSLGKALVEGAGPVLANQVGAVGANVAIPKLASMAGAKSAAYMPNLTQEAVNAAIPVGEGLANSTKDTIYTQAAKQAAKLRALARMGK